MSISNLLTYNINSSKNNIQSGTSDNFTYNVVLPADVLKKINSVSVSSVTIPKSFYQINENNNTFIISENNVDINITLIAGNYSLQQWFTALSSSLTTASLNGITYTVSFQYNNVDNGIMKITSSNAVLPISLKIGNSSICGVLGFDRNSINNFSSGVLLSSYVINLNESDMVYLNSNCVNSYYNDATNQSSNTLCIIYTGSYVNYSYVSQYFDIITNMKKFYNKNGVFNFYLVDENNDPINLHGVDLSFTINFFTYTQNDYTYTKVNNWIDYKVKSDIINDNND